MKVKISYLSLIRDITQVKEEEIEVPENTKIRDIIAFLLKKYEGLRPFIEQEILITLNGEIISDLEKEIQNNSEIIIGIPPFGG